MARAATFLLIGLIAGCEQDPRVLELTLRLPEALGCSPTAISEIELRALGDFPAREPNALILSPSGQLDSIERFPEDTEFVTIEARGEIEGALWTGGGVARALDGPIVISTLRLGRACPISSGGVPDGAAVIALPDGRLWIVGGDGSAIATFTPGEEIVSASPLSLFGPRIDATVSLIGDGLVLVAGGVPVEGADAYNTFEIFDPIAETTAASGRMERERRDHASIALADGRVLIVGGREAPVLAPLGDAEIIAIEEDEPSSTRIGQLAHPRADHVLVARTDGEILVVGGVGANGEAVGEIERFTGDGFEDIARFPPRREAAYAAIAGERVLQIGGRQGAGWTGSIDVLLEDDSIVSIDDAMMPTLESPRATALSDGRVVVAGRDPIDRRGRAFVIDLGNTPIAIDASRAPTVMVRLADGSIAQADPAGLSLVRVDLRTPLDPPRGTLNFTIPDDRAAVALDVPEHWQADPRGLVARVDGARFDLRELELADFTLDLDGEGGLSLLLTKSGAPSIDVLEACATEFVAPLHVVRSGDHVTIGDCQIALEGRAGIAVRAERDAIVRSLFLSRD